MKKLGTKSKQAVNSKPKFPYSDAEIEKALGYLRSSDDRAKKQLKISNFHFEILVALAFEGAKHVLSRRIGGRHRPRSDVVTKRMEAVLNSYCELPPKYRNTPTGERTVSHLRRAVIARLGLSDGDNVIPEDTVRHDLRPLGGLIRAIRMGAIRSNVPGVKPTERQLDRLRRNQARIGGKHRGQAPHDLVDRDVKLPEAVLQAAERANSYYSNGKFQSPPAHSESELASPKIGAKI